MTYNTRNQITGKSYSPGSTPQVTYCYDGAVYSNGSCAPSSPAVPNAKGRTSVGSPTSVTKYTNIDSLGRVLNVKASADRSSWTVMSGVSTQRSSWQVVHSLRAFVLA